MLQNLYGGIPLSVILEQEAQDLLRALDFAIEEQLVLTVLLLVDLLGMTREIESADFASSDLVDGVVGTGRVQRASDCKAIGLGMKLELKVALGAYGPIHRYGEACEDPVYGLVDLAPDEIRDFDSADVDLYVTLRACEAHLFRP